MNTLSIYHDIYISKALFQVLFLHYNLFCLQLFQFDLNFHCHFLQFNFVDIYNKFQDKK